MPAEARLERQQGALLPSDSSRLCTWRPLHAAMCATQRAGRVAVGHSCVLPLHNNHALVILLAGRNIKQGTLLRLDLGGLCLCLVLILSATCRAGPQEGRLLWGHSQDLHEPGRSIVDMQLQAGSCCVQGGRMSRALCCGGAAACGTCGTPASAQARGRSR